MIKGMDSEGENGQGESAQEGRASSGIVGMQAHAGTCSELAKSDFYNHIIATTCQRKP